MLQLSYNRMINHHGWKTGLKSTSCLHVYTEKTRLLNSWRVIHFLTLSAFLCYNPKNDLLLFSFYFSRNKLTINNPVKVFDKAIWGQNFSLQMTKIWKLAFNEESSNWVKCNEFSLEFLFVFQSEAIVPRIFFYMFRLSPLKVSFLYGLRDSIS